MEEELGHDLVGRLGVGCEEGGSENGALELDKVVLRVEQPGKTQRRWGRASALAH